MTTSDLSARMVTGTRDQRYGEVLLAYLDEPVRVEVFNSYGLNDCPLDVWATLDPTALAQQNGAAMAVLNGPRYWLMDGIGKVSNVEPVLVDFGGILMRRAATVEVDPTAPREFYARRTVNRGALFFWDAGKPVFQLTDPTGDRFVMQAYCTGVDDTLTYDALASLGERLNLPEGWTYSTHVLAEELRLDTTGEPAVVVQDELQNSYCRIG